MGWAIKRLDGTYRCWNANAQDDTLLAGEKWESLATPPTITSPPPPPNPLKALITAAMADPTVSPSLKALLTAWNAQL